MRRRMMKSKIHRATVTGADLHYIGSVSLDPELMKLADIREHEQVAILDIDNGARFETYAILGEPGQFQPHQLLTHALLHDNSSLFGFAAHLGGNLVFLLVFGSRINGVIGNLATLIVYPILAVGAARREPFDRPVTGQEVLLVARAGLGGDRAAVRAARRQTGGQHHGGHTDEESPHAPTVLLAPGSSAAAGSL